MKITTYFQNTLLVAMIFAAQTVWGQQVTITYDNPTSGDCNQQSTGLNVQNNYTFSAPIPACATNITGEAWGGGGGGGGTSSLGGHGGGGGGGGYIKLVFSTGTGNVSGQVGGGGKRGESGSNSGANGGQSYVAYNGTTISAYGGIGGTYRGPLGGTDNNASGDGGGTSGNGNINTKGSSGGSAGGGTGGAGGAGANGGSGGSVETSTGVGRNGCSPGGGGSSGYGFSEPAGHGGGGRVILSFTLSQPVITGTKTYCEEENLLLSVSNPCASANYIWKCNGTVVGYGTTLTLYNVTTADAGSYTVEYDQSGYTYSGGSVSVSGAGLTYNSGAFKLTSAGYAVSVTAEPTITLTSAISTLDQTICAGSGVTSTSYTFGGSATGVSITNLPAGLTYTTSGNTVTIDGIPTTSGTYTITTTGPVTSCQAATIDGIITVNTPPSIDNISVSTFCEGDILDDSNIPNYTSALAVTAHGWMLNGVTLPFPYILAADDNGKTLQYYATNSCGTGVSDGLIITVNTPPVIGDITFFSSTYCVGSNLLFPAVPTISSTSVVISEGWMLGDDIISDPHMLVFADEDKMLKYFATNSCGTTYSDSILITVIVTEIIAIMPAIGPTFGGTYTNDPLNPVNPTGTVTIKGLGFAPFGTPAVSSVSFGGALATNIMVIDDETLQCTPPPHVFSGDVTVSVTANCGTATEPNFYHYEAMNITDITPGYGPVTGGTNVIIRGTGLLAVGSAPSSAIVLFCGVPALVVSASNTEIVCITEQSNYSMLGSIKIFNGVESREFSDYFTYYPVTFINNGSWSEPYNWETQTDDRVLPYPGAVIHIKANCLQDINLIDGYAYPNGKMNSITVYPDKAYTIGNGITLDVNVFTLNDNASFINNGYMRATQQNITHLLARERNWYVSSPLTTMQPIALALGKGVFGSNLTSLGSVNLTSELVPSDWRVEWYKENDHKWERLPSSAGMLSTGLGYTVYSKHEDIAVNFSGIYNDGDVLSPVLTRQNDAHIKRGFNLVGNPFPSYWRWTEAAASNAKVYSTIWYRTVIAGEYEFWSYNAAGDVAVAKGWNDGTPTGVYSLAYIPPMQAFWVRLQDGYSTGAINFTNNRRSHADHTSNILKNKEITDAGERRMLRIILSGSKNADEILIYTDSKAQHGFDNYDSDKMFTGMGVELFSFPVAQNRELVINGLPEINDGMEIPLGFQTDEGGSFNLQAKEMLNFESLDVYLRDRLRNLEYKLSADSVYRFTSGSEYNTDRFSLVFRNGVTNNELVLNTEESNLRAYSDDEGNIIVLYKGKDNGNVTVYNTLGVILSVQQVMANSPTVLNGKFPKGIYVLRSGNYATKVAVQR